MDENKNPKSSGEVSENNEFNFVIEDPYAGKVSSSEGRHHHHHHHHHHSSSRSSGRKKKKHSTHKKVSKFKEPSVRFLTVWLAVLTLVCVILVAWNAELASSIKTVSDKFKAFSSDADVSVEDEPASDSDERIPGYVKNEAEEVIERVSELQSEDTVSFIAISDTHLKLDDNRSLECIEHAGQAMKLIREGLDIDFAALLGDVTWGANITPIDTGIKEMEKVNEFIADGFNGIPNFRLIGNHDTLSQGYEQNGDLLEPSELQGVIGKYNEGAVLPNEQNGYFYRDLEESKLRVICINTSEIDIDEEQVDLDVLPEQVKWLADSLDLSAKADSGDWKILILSHHPLNWYEQYAEMIDVIDAYTLGASGSVNVEGVDVSFDFAGKNAAKIVANIHGHLHNYKMSSIGDSRIPAITIPNASYNRNNEYGTLYSYSEDIKNRYGEKTTYEKIENSAEDTAFSVVTIDLKYNRIYVTNYGAGYDRELGF